MLISAYPKLCAAIDADDLFTQLMLDCTHPNPDVTLPDETIHLVEQLNHDFTYALHRDRTVKMCSIQDDTGLGVSDAQVCTTQE